MQTIAVTSTKGGTGKTTCAVNLAATWALRGRRVLLVDLDAQGAASRWLGVADDGRLAEALGRGGGLLPMGNIRDNLDVAPGGPSLDAVGHELRPTQGGQLRRILEPLKVRYDRTIIDCPPGLGNRLVANALLAASHALVPVECSILALDAVQGVLAALDDVRDGLGHAIALCGILACRFDARTRLSGEIVSELHRAMPGQVLRTVVRERVQLREAPAHQQTIFEYRPGGDSAQDFDRLARELERRL